MGKRKRKLTPAEKAKKKRRQKEYMSIFINGQQKRAKRPPTINGMDGDEFIRRNTDPIWLLQNEMYEELYQQEQKEEQENSEPAPARDLRKGGHSDDDLPF